MAVPREVETDRLRLRRWREADRQPFAAMNADPRVMEHFPAVQSRDQSDAAYERIVSHFEQHGFGVWAVEVPGLSPFIGFVGLCIPRFDAAFTPCVEIGWRLDRAYWGQGFATEAARASLQFGFESLGLNEIVSYTVPANTRSRRVMERVGMERVLDGDFDHPLLPADHPLSRHVLYRVRRANPTSSTSSTHSTS